MTKHFWRRILPNLQSKAKLIIWIFYADPDFDKKIKILEDFMNRDINIMIYTDAIKISINISDIKYVIQYKKYNFLTLTILIQYIR